MRKLMTLTLAVLMVGLFAAVVYAAVDAGDDSTVPGDTTTTETTDTTDTTDTTETTETTETPTTPDARPDRDDTGRGFDVSGPCDEAEHANDPRCTGAAVDGDDGDHSGPGRGGDDDDHGGDDHDNSGPGGGGSSGHGGDDD